MTKVDFYTGSKDKLRTACQLSHKAMQNGIRTVICLPDENTRNALDKLLWHFPPTAFIPHCMSEAEEAEKMPVVMNLGNDKLPHFDLLISLHHECLPFFSRFERVIEIVGNEADEKQKGRDRFKYYKDRGYELSHIDLNITSSN